MRPIILATLLLASTASAELSTVCSKVVPVKGNMVYKSQISGHLLSTDRSKSCSFIFGPRNYAYPRMQYLPIYDSRGVQVAQFVAYELGGCPYPARWYTAAKGPSCAEISAKIYKSNKNRIAYIGVGGGLCYKVNDVRTRQGSPVPADAAKMCKK